MVYNLADGIWYIVDGIVDGIWYIVDGIWQIADGILADGRWCVVVGIEREGSQYSVGP